MRTALKKFLYATLNWLAVKTIKRFGPTIVAVTGSVGKTSTKEAIYAVVSLHRRARCNVGNFNAEYGVPLTILGNWTAEDLRVISRDVDSKPSAGAKVWFFTQVIVRSFFRLIFGWKGLYPEVLVLEYGADKPGDISYLTKIAKPNIAVVAAVGDVPVHVQFYESPEAVVKEKGKLIEALAASGLAVLNGDEDRVAAMASKTRATSLTYGFSEKCDIRVIDFENKVEMRDGQLKPVGIIFKLGYDGAFVPVRINGTLGIAQAYSAAAAACVGLAFSMNLVDVSQALANYKPPAQRMQFIRGINDSVVLDDSYNASPLSMKLAIDTVKSLKAKRKVAVIGDMRELGMFAGVAHQQIGQQAAKTFDVIVAVGPEAQAFAQAASKARIAKKNIFYAETIDGVLGQLPALIQPGDLVLIKASHSIHLDQAVAALRA
jgi:UDP-N-acetylmuramoyl-tripeptide--D-alanyl-D-alanine ligase